MRFAALPIAGLALFLAACSGGKAPPQAAAEQTPPPPQKTVFDTQFKALQKAKDVQKTVDQQKADMDKQLKDAGE